MSKHKETRQGEHWTWLTKKVILNSIYNYIYKSVKEKIRYICRPSLGQKSMKNYNLNTAEL